MNMVNKSGTIKHYLYNNEDDGEYLLPEFKHLDFLWLIKDDIMHDDDVRFARQFNKNITMRTTNY